MPVLNEIGGLEQVIDTFDFRNKGAIKIPKSRRSKAYIQAVDVIVNTIDFNLYENNKAIPNLQFYGYATLVFEDCLALEVPLRFPRMRIHQQRNEMALSQWRRIEEYYSAPYQWFSFFFGLVAAGQDPPLDPPPAQMPLTRFIELPLREVYVNVQDNCQFQIEYSQWQPIGFTAPDGRNFNGSSGQTDGDKDGGLPDGIQPRRNSPNNPFNGNRPVSSSIQLGEFLNGKIDNLGNISPENAPLNLVYWLRFDFYSLTNPQGTVQKVKDAYFPSAIDPQTGNPYPLEVRLGNLNPISATCGGATKFREYILLINGVEKVRANWRDNYTWSAIAESGVAYPPNGVSSLIQNGWCSI